MWSQKRSVGGFNPNTIDTESWFQPFNERTQERNRSHDVNMKEESVFQTLTEDRDEALIVQEEPQSETHDDGTAELEDTHTHTHGLAMKIPQACCNRVWLIKLEQMTLVCDNIQPSPGSALNNPLLGHRLSDRILGQIAYVSYKFYIVSTLHDGLLIYSCLKWYSFSFFPLIKERNDLILVLLVSFTGTLLTLLEQWGKIKSRSNTSTGNASDVVKKQTKKNPL